MKINGNMTLFELQEYCLKVGPCSACKFDTKDDTKSWRCIFRNTGPAGYELYKSKTYKEDLLKRFPNAVLSTYDHRPQSCVASLYGERHKPDECGKFMEPYSCADCWNRIMPEEE